MPGFVYIVSNDAMPGILKIGYTDRGLRDRLSELNNTSVPVPFTIEFYIETETAHSLEQRLHSHFRKQLYGKEYYKISVKEAVQQIKILIEKEKILYEEIGGRAKNKYLTDDEVKEIEKQEEINRKKIRDELEKKKTFDKKVSLIVEGLLRMSPIVNEIIKNNSVAGGGSAVRKLVGYAAVLSVVGWAVSDDILPTAQQDGRKLIHKLSKKDQDIIQGFGEKCKELEELGKFDLFALKWKERRKIEGNYLRSYSDDYLTKTSQFSNQEMEMSDYLSGALWGLRDLKGI